MQSSPPPLSLSSATTVHGRLLVLLMLTIAALLGILSFQQDAPHGAPSGIQQSIQPAAQHPGVAESAAAPVMSAAPAAPAMASPRTSSTTIHPAELIIGHCLAGGTGQHTDNGSTCVPPMPAVHAVGEHRDSTPSGIRPTDAAHPSSVDSGRAVVPSPQLDALSISRT